MDQVSETPLGFLESSKEFLLAANLLFSKLNEGCLPGYFLLGRSIELSLKAYLMSRGVSIGELRKKKYGHNLHVLLHEAKHRDLGDVVPMEDIEIGVIELLSCKKSQGCLQRG